MEIAEQVEPPVPITRACEALGISRATLYRRTAPPSTPNSCTDRPVPRMLKQSERQAIIDVLHSSEFADQPPYEVYATLLNRGVYLGSIRTMYRVLAALGETKERRALRGSQQHAKPSVEASEPNQVWTWDITKLAGPEAGTFYCLYVILDLFSRYVVGWLLAEHENTALAKQLFAEALLRHGVEPGQLVVHSDRGSPMKSEGLGQLLGNLGVKRSFSRPRVSDDNPFSEAQFKTLKYQPDYPRRFTSLLHARAYCQDFFGWHNEQHHHSGLALFTPADVFHCRVSEVAAQRQAALDAAYRNHPERFPNGPPKVRLPSPTVSINPLNASDATSIIDASTRSAPQNRLASDNVDGRHGARHEVKSCFPPATTTSDQHPSSIVSSLAALHSASEPISRNPTPFPS